MVYEGGGIMEEIKGTTIVDGIRCGHLQSEVEAIKRIIEFYKPDTFVELGVHEGGLAYQLIPAFPNTLYIGVEINCQIVVPRVKIMFEGNPNDLLLCRDCLDPTIMYATKGKTLIYCDNGHKTEEMKFFAPLIKVDDIIMCHDYCKDDYYNYIPEIGDYGKPDTIPVPEVHYKDLEFLRNKKFKSLPEQLLYETRIAGYIRTENE
jgi:cephalosporin hydroxylase